VLISGVDATVRKTCTITNVGGNDDDDDDAVMGDDNVDEDHVPNIFLPLNHCTLSTIKVACEPLSASELPKMVSGLRKIEK
jgi:116 kDa U5 small nuclear ribonucleoprotein component